METKILLGISACLLAEKVRYDGGQKGDRFIIETLGNYVDFVPVCPEVECGLGVPREAMRLMGDPENPRLITIHSKMDYTERMKEWTRLHIAGLTQLGLGGFIFKSNSPSCGLSGMDVYNENGIPIKKGIGLFTREWINRFPQLPAIDETGLQNPQLRKEFIDSLCLS